MTKNTKNQMLTDPDTESQRHTDTDTDLTQQCPDGVRLNSESKTGTHVSLVRVQRRAMGSLGLRCVVLQASAAECFSCIAESRRNRRVAPLVAVLMTPRGSVCGTYRGPPFSLTSGARRRWCQCRGGPQCQLDTTMVTTRALWCSDTRGRWRASSLHSLRNITQACDPTAFFLRAWFTLRQDLRLPWLSHGCPKVLDGNLESRRLHGRLPARDS